MKIKIIASLFIFFPLIVLARVSDLNQMISVNLDDQVQIQRRVENHAQENTDHSHKGERSPSNVIVIDIGGNQDNESIKNIPMSYNQ